MKSLVTITTHNKDAPSSVIEIGESLINLTIEVGDDGIVVSSERILLTDEPKWWAGESMRKIPHEIFTGGVTLYPKGLD